MCRLFRPLAATQVVIGACTGALMIVQGSGAQTMLLFTARALSMGSYAILYVYTPEASFPLVYLQSIVCHTCLLCRTLCGGGSDCLPVLLMHALHMLPRRPGSFGLLPGRGLMWRPPAAAQVFPTRVRALGLGVCNVMSRIGALLSPFLTVDLVERGYPAIAEVAISGACLAAAVATAILPLETSGKALMVRPDQAADLWQAPCLSCMRLLCSCGWPALMRGVAGAAVFVLSTSSQQHREHVHE